MIKLIILAAGKGTRMRSDLPKVLHTISGRTLLEHVLEEADKLYENCDICVVINQELQHHPKFKEIESKYNFDSALQENQKGTGHAVLCALDSIDTNKYIDIIITCADTPLISADTFNQLIAKHHSTKSYATCVCFETKNPFGYGRVVVNEIGKIEQVIEQKDLIPEQHALELCNSGVMMLNTKDLVNFLKQIRPNQTTKELYLTDLYRIASQNNKTCSFICAPQEEMIGINDQKQRAKAEDEMQKRIAFHLASKGVYIIRPETSYFAQDIEIEHGVTIYPNVYIGSGTKIKKGTEVHSFSWLADCTIGSNCTIGPFARIRPKTVLSSDVKIGNFVEVKNTQIESRTKASHLAYIGDATIKEDVNVGAGAIFCNYDGVNKHQSIVERNSFIGSNSSIISPVHIAEGSLIAAGSVITKDTEKDKIAIRRPSIQKSIKKKG